MEETMEQVCILKTFRKYVTLNVLGMIGLSCYILADTYFVSKGLGTNGLASLNLAISIYSFVHGLGLMIGIGGATKYAILKAKQEHEEANKIFSTSINLGIIIGILITLIGIFLSKPLSRILGANEHTFAMTNTYLKTILSFAPFFILNNVLIAFVRNDGDPKLSMAGMLIGSFSNVILDYIFIFPLNMGMFGAAFATGLAPIISLCILSLHFIKNNNNFSYKKIRISIKRIFSICSLGTSSLITEISSGIVLIIFNIVILNLEGNTGVAAYGIVANLSLVSASIFTGIAQGIQPLISSFYGNKNVISIKKIFRYAIVLSLIIAVCLYIIVFVFSNQLVSIFNSENNDLLRELAVIGLRLYFIGFLFAGINIITASFFSSIEQARLGFIISIVRSVVAIIPVVLALSSIFGINGVWTSFPCAELISFVIVAVCLKKHNEKIKKCI